MLESYSEGRTMTHISSTRARIVQVEGDDHGSIGEPDDATALVRHFMKQPTVNPEGCLVNLCALRRQAIVNTFTSSKASCFIVVSCAKWPDIDLRKKS